MYAAYKDSSMEYIYARCSSANVSRQKATHNRRHASLAAKRLSSFFSA